MTQTPRLALPLLAAGQSQKDVTHNEALLALDRLVALTVASRTLPTPPPSPAAGQCHIVPAAGAAAWGAAAGSLACWQGSGWLIQTPRDGQTALVADEGLMLVYRGAWQAFWPVAGLSIGGRSVLSAAPATLSAPSGGSTIDAEARSLLSALLTALRAQGIIN